MLLRRTGVPWGSWRGPWGEVDRLRQEMDRLVGALSGDVGQAAAAGLYPPINVYEEGSSYVVTAEMPGVDPADLEISVEGRTLSIKGERKAPEISEGARYHRRERGQGRFSRALTLPLAIEPAQVQAQSADGVLTITLPKEEKAQPRRIEVQGA